MTDDLLSGIPILIPDLPSGIASFLALQLQPIPVLPSLAVVLAFAYLTLAYGRRQAKSWPWDRTCSFLAGCLLLFLISGTAIEGYGFVLVSVFMFQQLTLMMAIPVLMVLGLPGQLILRGGHRWPALKRFRSAFALFLRSKFLRGALHPLVLFCLFVLAFYGLYLTDIGTIALQSWWGHTSLELLFLISGTALAIPLVGNAVIRARWSPLSKLLTLIAEMPIHALFGVIVMMSTTLLVTPGVPPPEAWDVQPLVDQGVAGALAWTYGELPMLVLIVIMLVRWERDDTKRARRVDRERGDADLDSYNAYLASLQRTPNKADTLTASLRESKEHNYEQD